MSKLRKILKQLKRDEAAGKNIVAVPLIPDTYQVILTISKDGKKADMEELVANSQIPTQTLALGLLLVRDQLLFDFGAENLRRELRANRDPEKN